MTEPKFALNQIVYFNSATQFFNPHTRSRSAVVVAANWRKCKVLGDEWVYTIEWSHSGKALTYAEWQLGTKPYTDTKCPQTK